MNIEEIIQTQASIAMQQFPDDAAARFEYHVGLLETKLREFAWRLGQTPDLVRVPVLTVIEAHDFPLLAPGPVAMDTSNES